MITELKIRKVLSVISILFILLGIAGYIASKKFAHIETRTIDIEWISEGPAGRTALLDLYIRPTQGRGFTTNVSGDTEIAARQLIAVLDTKKELLKNVQITYRTYLWGLFTDTLYIVLSDGEKFIISQ